MKVYTPAEVAEILKVCLRTVDRLIKRGKLPASEVGSLKRITEAQLNRYLEGNEFRPGPANKSKPTEPAHRGRSSGRGAALRNFERV